MRQDQIKPGDIVEVDTLVPELGFKRAEVCHALRSGSYIVKFINGVQKLEHEVGPSRIRKLSLLELLVDEEPHEPKR